MGTRDPRVDAYIKKAAPFAQPILTEIRETVHASCPDVEEAMKWSFPHFLYKGMLCGMASFKEHAAFGFWKGARTGDAAAGAHRGAEEEPQSAGRLRGSEPEPQARIHRVDHGGKDRRDPCAPARA